MQQKWENPLYKVDKFKTVSETIATIVIFRTKLKSKHELAI